MALFISSALPPPPSVRPPPSKYIFSAFCAESFAISYFSRKVADPTWKMTSVAVPGMDASKKSAAGSACEAPPGVESVAGIEVGLRCQVSPGGRRGVVKFIGEVPEMKAGGYWIGVGTK
jgi:hypothetical protein